MIVWKENKLIIHSWGIFLVVEMLLLWFNSPIPSSLPIPLLEKFFWPIWIFAIILIAIPIYVFRKKGGVKKGESYINTQYLVNNGIFAIIRHPQYTGGIWIAFVLILPNQSWLIIVFAVLAIISYTVTIHLEEEKLVEKFGENYIEYKKRTSSCSFLIGVFKSYKYKKNQK